MNQIQLIPEEIQSIIPRFDGDEKLLNLFISKCEYVIRSFRGEDNQAQQTYLYHCITSRLIGKAAVLVSERENIHTWEELKEIFIQHFGDPRSEACISIELDNLKIKQGESYIEFCYRIQNVRSSLISKVNILPDEGIKAAKYIIYNNAALNVFLYNLPEDMIKFVRLNKCTTLETALSVVMEEVNFQTRYNAKNKVKSNFNNNNQGNQNQLPKHTFTAPLQHKFGNQTNNQTFKPAFKSNFEPNNNNFPNRFNNQPQGFKPNLQQPFRPNVNRPFNGPPQQFPRTVNNYKQSGFFKANPNQQFRFGINNNNQQSKQNADVSMRTVRNNMLNDQEQPDYDYEQDAYEYIDESNIEEYNTDDDILLTEGLNENFQLEASMEPPPK